MKLDISEQERVALIAALLNYVEVVSDGCVDTVGEIIIDLKCVTNLIKTLEEK